LLHLEPLLLQALVPVLVPVLVLVSMCGYDDDEDVWYDDEDVCYDEEEEVYHPNSYI
jgi:hypothetical protein